MTSDAYSLVAMSQEKNSIGTMLDLILENSGYSAGDVHYLNAHGTSTIQNDEIEATIIDEKFPHGPYVNSTKSLLGHTVGACGAVEAAVTALTLQTGRIHPTVGLRNPIRDLNFPLYPARAAIKLALTQNFGFGGHNVGVLFSAC